MEGGVGDKLRSTDVDQSELKVGIEVELEHTDSRLDAQDIALDHLAENPHYYSHLVRSGLVDEPAAIRKYKELFGETKVDKIRKIIREEIINLLEADYWLSPVGKADDFKDKITDEIIDGKTKYGPWALMTPKSFKKHGVGKLGTGYGQRYKKQKDGKWLKTEG